MTRSNPVGLFTGIPPAEYRLPHRRLGLPVILIIRRVLCRAFESLREQDVDLANAIEDDVTAKLKSVIENDIRQKGTIPGFDKRTFDCVIRQGEVANYDGTRRSKTPDLCFKLRNDELEDYDGLSEHDALFVECKPVDSTHPVGSKYCDDGLVRFVCGDYAWAMQEGMMLAYARNGRTIAGHLIPEMKVPTRMKSLGTIQLPQPSSSKGATANDHAETIHISKHKRHFSWPDGKGPATDIAIYHVWHDCG